MRQTSIDAYFNQAKPGLNNKQRIVLEALEDIAPANDKQLAAYLNWPINSITPRRGELVKNGRVIEAYIHKDLHGRKQTYWKPKDMREEEYGDVA